MAATTLRCGLAILPLAAPCAAQPIHVLTLGGSRPTVCGTIDYNFVTGNAHSALRDALLDPARFGPSGTVPRPVELLPQVSTFTCNIPSGTDVLILTSGSPPGGCELGAIERFVRAGGGLVALSNDAPEWLASRFGARATGVQGEGGLGTFAVHGHPILAGPFGALTGTLPFNDHLVFDTVGSSGRTIISSSRAAGAAFTVGAGRAFVIGDEEWAMSLSFPGCAAGNMQPKGLTMFLNAFAYVVPAPTFEWIDVCPCYPDCEADCALDIFDFLCFQNRFAAGDPYACGCDTQSGPGVCDIFDFLCFQNAFAAGCP